MISWKRYFAELVGTAALFCTVIGSGIMAEQLAGGNTAIALLANTLATVFALYVLIETIGPISGAHFNPVVSMVMAFRKDLARHHLMGYVIAQLTGAALGAWAAHAMFELEILQWSV
jgi:glycerol uptake facilitator-like aquaporin